MRKLLVTNYTGCFKAMNDIAKHFGSRKEAFDTVQAIRREYINKLKDMTLAKLIFTLDLYAEKGMNQETVIQISTFADEGEEIMLYSITRSEIVAEATREVIAEIDGVKKLNVAQNPVFYYVVGTVLNHIGDFVRSPEEIAAPESFDEEMPF